VDGNECIAVLFIQIKGCLEKMRYNVFDIDGTV
jgi:hypothetical protein